MGINLHPYLSPTGGGMTSNKELAERMEQLRFDYIEACKQGANGDKARIIDDEIRLVGLIHNEKMEVEREVARRIMTNQERFIRVVEYYSVPIDTGRGFTKPDVRERSVYLDTHEVEMTIMPPTDRRFGDHVIRMRSGREISVSEEDLKLIEAAMRERES